MTTQARREKADSPEAAAIRARMELFYEGHLHITCREFERNMGRSAGYVANFSGRPRTMTLAMFSKVYPMLNLDWLLTGQGSMINPGFERKSMEVHTMSKKKQRVKYVADLTEASIQAEAEAVAAISKGDTNIGHGATMIKESSSSGDVHKLIENLIEENKAKQKMIDRLIGMLEKLTQPEKQPKSVYYDVEKD